MRGLRGVYAQGIPDYTTATATLHYANREADLRVRVVYSDHREDVVGVAYLDDRKGAPSPDAWLSDELSGLDRDILHAIGAQAEQVVVPYGLRAEELADGWCVVDPDGGRWWPSEEAAREISEAPDSEDMAIHLCVTAVRRGAWHS